MSIQHTSSVATHLLDRLPEVKGKYRTGVMMSDITWFRVGGAAEVLFSPADADDLQHFLANTPLDVPVSILGAGSNTLVRDGGMAGVMIKLGGALAQVTVDEQNILTAGAAALDMTVAKMAAKHSLTGLEFYAGIPGSIGGALRMNAGAYDGETADCFISATAVERTGKALHFNHTDMGFAYRHSNVGDDIFFVSAQFGLSQDNQKDILKRMSDITSSRESTQPVKSRTGGSTFRNPCGTNPDGPKAWKLIDDAGCRGLRVGDAQMSELHCNFMINHGEASAADLETLGEEVRRKVLDLSGIELHWEIKRIGLTDIGFAVEHPKGGAV